MNVPKLRFPEFSGAWKHAKAGEAFGSRRTKGREGLPIYSVTIDRGMVRRNALGRQIEADAADGANLLAKPGDLVYNMMRMWQGAVGQAPEECMVSPAYVVLSPKNGTDSKFFGHWFKSRRMVYLFWAYSQGLTNDRLRLYFDDFARVPLRLPVIDEQKKIADLLSQIETRIWQLGKKRDLVTKYRSGVLALLFKHELRFCDESGNDFPDWEEKTLQDVLTVKHGKDYKHLGEGTVPLFGSGGVMGYVSQAIYEKPSVLIGRKGTIDKPLYIDEPFWTVDTLFYTEIHEGYLPYFVFLLVSQVDWLKHNQATGVPSLNTDAINSVKIKVPTDIREQRKIADFIAGLDSKIAAIEGQLEIVKKFKLGLLQQMFV